ncbi:MAG: translation initiation factor IF-2 N-terminal domain-containing protein [Desulfobacterales bacterium]|nr:translation initiation factor IF-2 N-terminal domain-containing protein [Desulfobacterales bacterium]
MAVQDDGFVDTMSKEIDRYRNLLERGGMYICIKLQALHELAQKMGIDNKELIAKFQAVGVEVTSHMAVVTEEDIGSNLPPSPAVKETSQEETRVQSPTVIRRRPKMVEEPVAPVAVAAEEPAAPVPASAPTEENTVEHVETTPEGTTGSSFSAFSRSRKGRWKSSATPAHSGQSLNLRTTFQEEPAFSAGLKFRFPHRGSPGGHRNVRVAPEAAQGHRESTNASRCSCSTGTRRDCRGIAKRPKRQRNTAVVDMDGAPKKVAAAGKKKDTCKKVEIIEKRELKCF